MLTGYLANPAFLVRNWPAWTQHALAAAVVCVALFARALLDDSLDDRLTYAMLFGVLLPLVVLVRPLPFLFAATLGCLGVVYFFESPRFTLMPSSSRNAIELAIFLAAIGIAALTAWLSRRADSQVRASDALLRSFVDDGPVPTCVTTGQGQVVYSNAAAARAWGRERAEVVGRMLGEILPPERGRGALAQIEAVHTTGQPQTWLEEASDVSDGGRVYEWRRFALNLGSGSALVGAMATDLTDRVRAERALRDAESRRAYELAAALDQRTEEVRRAEQALARSSRMAAVGTMASGLAHDLKNVLHPFSNRITSLMALPSMPSEARADLTVALALTDHLRQMARNLELFASDPEQEGTEGRTDLAPWMRRVQGLLETSIDAGRKETDRWIRLKSDIPDQLPPVAIAPHRLTQTVLSLVYNARDAIRAARPVVRSSVEAGCIEIQARASEDGAIMISVADDGCGMPPETARKSVEPFFTTKGRPALSGSSGDGMGLALASAVCERVGGRLEIESRMGEGTTVTLVLPAARGEDAAA